MRLGADVIIATPGRLISHIRMGNVDLSKVSFFVLDEADRMLDMGFCDDIMQIASKMPKSRQTIMFSATMPDKIQQLAKSLLTDPVEIKIAVSKPAEKIQQSAYVCYDAQKSGIIKHLFSTNKLKRVIIFSGKKDKVKDIYRELQKMKINCCQMHSDLTQQERDEVMYLFKTGQRDVLVATDIVARGIDIDDIAMVINYDVPHDAEDYVHRIGRTARADRDGVAITFVNEKDIMLFQRIEAFLEKEIVKNELPEESGKKAEYKALSKDDGKRHTRHRGSRHGGRRGNKPRNNAKGTDSKRKTDDTKTASTKTTQTGNPEKRKSRNRRRSRPSRHQESQQTNKDNE